MLNVFRRHGEGCPLKGKRRGDKHGKGFCPLKPPCRIYFEGIDGVGTLHRPHVLTDPETGSTVRDWNRACEIIRGGAKPANLTVNGPVKFAIEDTTLYLIDESGKEHRTEIAKKVLRQPSEPPK